MVDVINPDTFFRENLSAKGFALTRAQDRLMSMRDGMTGFGSGLHVLNPYFKLMPGELTTIGGRAGTGKTAIGLQIVHNVLVELKASNRPGKVCVFSAEMDGETLMLREACAWEKIPLWHLQTGQATKEEYERVSNRLSNMDDERMMIDESSAPTLEHMISQLEIVREVYGKIAMVLFDYTELSGEFERVESQRIAKISRGLKAIAKKYQCPVLTLSQLNRDIESRSDRTPTMRDLMHGGEREPDRIMVLLRPWLYDKAQQKDLVYAYIVKNRNGPLGEAALFFHEQTMRFSSAEIFRTDLNEE